MKIAAGGTSAASDFDFLIGEWSVRHHRLKERLVGSSEWEDFGGTTVAHEVLGGLGNVDDNVIELPAGTYRALTLRTFDPQQRRWSIWWLDARFPQQLDTPVRGSFANGVGTFYADDQFGGKPIVVRFIWSEITRATCRWQQAFSADAGATWETNWVMEFERRAR